MMSTKTKLFKFIYKHTVVCLPDALRTTLLTQLRRHGGLGGDHSRGELLQGPHVLRNRRRRRPERVNDFETPG